VIPLRCVVLISGSGTLLKALLDAIAAGELAAQVVAVGADRVAPGLAWPREHGVETFVHPFLPGADRGQWDQQLMAKVAEFEPDLVILAGFMKLLGEAFLARFGGRLINTHPALLPSFPGSHAVRDALHAGVKVTGCTIFEVDAGVDTGPIIAQEAVAVLPGDDEEALHERIKQVERRLLVEVVGNWTNEMRK
jgi:phosphoribosylglycinamide formyltransferase-1